MSEEIKADTPQEGANPFENMETETEDSELSPDETNGKDDTHSPDGGQENNQDDPDKDKPFHEHPRWKQREQEWEERFNAQEARQADEIKSIREEFASARKDNADKKEEIPKWFGGSQEQWDEYIQWEDQRLAKAEERALSRVNEAKTKTDKAVEEATAFMNSEINAIQGDEALNPNKLKIDANKLLKIVMDNDLIDTKGRWNYRAGFKLMAASESKPAAPAINNQNRKGLAAATTSESKTSEPKPKDFKTRDDFKQNRPW